jgi:hypothetical protein
LKKKIFSSLSLRFCMSSNNLPAANDPTNFSRNSSPSALGLSGRKGAAATAVLLTSASAALTLSAQQVLNISALGAVIVDATNAITWPTAANLIPYLTNPVVNQYIPLRMINAYGSSVSIAESGNGGNTIAVPSSTTQLGRTVFIRLTNVTSGSYAYVLGYFG